MASSLQREDIAILVIGCSFAKAVCVGAYSGSFAVCSSGHAVCTVIGELVSPCCSFISAFPGYAADVAVVARCTIAGIVEQVLLELGGIDAGYPVADIVLVIYVIGTMKFFLCYPAIGIVSEGYKGYFCAVTQFMGNFAYTVLFVISVSCNLRSGSFIACRMGMSYGIWDGDQMTTWSLLESGFREVYRRSLGIKKD